MADTVHTATIAAPAGSIHDSAVIALSGLALAIGIFLFDILSPLGGAVAVLYVVVLVMVSRSGNRRFIMLASGISVALTAVAFVSNHWGRPFDAATLRVTVSLAAILITTALLLRIQATTQALAAQASLLDLSHDMIFRLDKDGLITFWNRAAEETYGWSKSEALGQRADDLLKARYVADPLQVRSDLVANGRWEGALEHTTRTGRLVPVDSRWAVEQDAQGRVIGVLETNTDVTEKRAQLEALKRSEQRFRRMFDSSRIGVLQQNWSEIGAALRAEADGANVPAVVLAADPAFVSRARRLVRTEDANPALLNMIGMPRDEGSAPKIDRLFAPDERTFGAALAAYARGESFFEGETRITHANGDDVPVLFTMTFPPRNDEDNSVLVFALDVSERKAAQDALVQAQAELSHALRVATLGELTASIAHEVNQPLMAVVTSGDAALRWLRRPEPDLPEIEAALVRLTSEGRRAGEIVKRIRDFLARSEVKMAQIDSERLVTDAVALVAREIDKANVELSVTLDRDLAPLYGDRVQLQQVLVNLLLNAIQAMTAQTYPRRLDVSAHHRDGRVVITVDDNGPGIPDEHVPKLFDAFFTTRADGMGMGLAISRRTLEAHGGQLTVERPTTGGARFQVSLNAANSSDSDA